MSGMEQVRGLIEKLPVNILVGAYLAYVAYGFYNFQYAPDSPRQIKTAEKVASEDGNAKLEVKIKERTEFYKTLDVKKAELRKLAQDLDNMKATLSEGLDVPQFMKSTVTEAKKVGLTVMALKPLPGVKKEFYNEDPFEFKFKGVYVQLLVFLDRLSQSQRIVRIDDFNINPKGSSLARYVDLEGTLMLKTYSYRGSSADEVSKKTQIPEPPVAAPKKPDDAAKPPAAKTGGDA